MAQSGARAGLNWPDRKQIVPFAAPDLAESCDRPWRRLARCRARAGRGGEAQRRVHRLLQQFLGDVEWGELDYLVCDLPPGTGDVQLSLSQLIPIAGSVMVTTPQEVSIVDVVKGIAMFEKVEIPILGIVENMSHYTCPACGHRDEIFSHGGGKRLAQEVGTAFLGEIPIDTRIRFGGDAGVPIVIASPDSAVSQGFMQLASTVALKLATAVLARPKKSPRLAVIK